MFLVPCLFPLIILTYQMVESPETRNKEPETIIKLFDELLKTYVDEQGLVDYASLKADRALEPVLAQMEQVQVTELSDAEAIAFWINAYNAYTIKLIVDNYPVKSIREITPLRIKGLSLAIPKINSPFEYNIATIEGKKYSLDDIEHGILRKHFEEPRIHFALVCAAMSCPKLRREAYAGADLDRQLDEQARSFLTDPSKNRIDPNSKRIYLSKIFRWFKRDFTTGGRHLQAFLATYFEGDLRDRLEKGAFKVKFLKYDWSLNASL